MITMRTRGGPPFEKGTEKSTDRIYALEWFYYFQKGVNFYNISKLSIGERQFNMLRGIIIFIIPASLETVETMSKIPLWQVTYAHTQLIIGFLSTR